MSAPGHPPRPADEFRIGHGYDLHRLEPRPPAGQGRPLIVGGVSVDPDGAFGRGPIAHSDGDALLHAVTDALLAAAGLPDIGQLFPDTDPRHESQDSREFLVEAGRRVRSAGFDIANIDATVILERPKIAAHKDAMRGVIAGCLGLGVERVGLKGKTHERVDAVGEGRAIEVHVVALLVRSKA